VGRQLGPLSLKGLAFVRGRRHGDDDTSRYEPADDAASAGSAGGYRLSGAPLLVAGRI